MSSPNVDNFDFGVIQDSLGQSMGTAIPNRALMLVCGGIGSGKSIMGQRMSFGMTANDVKVSLFTTELTTRGWLEQVSSIGYYMDKRIESIDSMQGADDIHGVLHILRTRVLIS